MKKRSKGFQGFQVKERVMSRIFKEENLDSLDLYENFLVVTAKSTNELLVFDKFSLKLLKRVKGYEGYEGYPSYDNLKRPNGIKIVDDLCFIVERDSHRVSVYRLPSFKLEYRFGEDILKTPYGIDVIQKYEKKENVYELYITDNKIYDGGGVVYVFSYYENHKLHKKVTLKRSFGEKILKKVESVLLINSVHTSELILVADEKRKTISMFDLKGKYIDELHDKFIHEPEGIASYNKYGIDIIQGLTIHEFIICVDQGPTIWSNRFLVFKIFNKEFNYLGYFITKNTKNTDGICIDNMEGMLYAIDDDKRITKIKIK